MAARYLERVVVGDERGVLSWVIRTLMWPLSVVYRAGLWLYLGVYALGLRKRWRLGVPVVSVGNLTFGGTGKTPVVQAICRMLRERGLRVVILSRGHGGSARGVVVVSDGDSILSDSSEAGDEPVLLARTLPGVPVVVGKDRRESGRLACERFAPDVILLDDGLQYWQLHRDLDIVVLDARRPFGSGLVMPAGDLREPVSGLRRAGVVLLSDSGGMVDAEFAGLEKRVRPLTREALVLRCARRPSSVRKARSDEEMGLEWLRRRRVAAFCGIGRPASFVEMLESLDAAIVGVLMFPDHHRYTAADLALIEDERNRGGAEAVITTEKDLARLGGNASVRDLYVLGIELDIEERQRFAQYIANRINRKDQAPAAEEAAD